MVYILCAITLLVIAVITWRSMRAHEASEPDATHPTHVVEPTTTATTPVASRPWSAAEMRGPGAPRTWRRRGRTLHAARPHAANTGHHYIEFAVNGQRRRVVELLARVPTDYERPAKTTYAISLQPSLALSMCWSPVSLDRNPGLPPLGVRGTTVMIVALGKIIGSARFTGVVTLNGETVPEHEHPSAENIRRSLTDRVALFGPRLWVFEDGVTFNCGIPVEVGTPGEFWPLPDDAMAALDEARLESVSV